MQKKLRDYQEKAIDAIKKALARGVTKQLLVLPTGAGKTFCAVKALEPFKRKIWLTHTEELMAQSGTAFLHELYPELDIQMMIDTHGGLLDYIQAVRSYDMFSDLPENEILKNIGIVKAEVFDIDADVVIASMQTLHRRLDRISPDAFDAVIVDEAHLACAPTVVKSINHFNPKLLLGLTATPHRADGALLGDIFEEIVFQYNIAEAIDDGYLVELDALAIQTKLSLDNVHTLGGEFNQKELKQTVDTPSRNKLIVDKYKQYADGLQNLVFCVDVEHAQNVCQAFKDAGYRAEFIVGDKELTPDRKALINRFKTGQTQILTNVMVLTAGFDYPGIGCLTLACPTKSLTKFFQQVGRATRTLPKVIDGLETPVARKLAIKASAKPKAIILDIVDTTSKHRIINTWTLDKDKPHEEKTFVTTERREMLVDARKKREFESERKKDTRVNLFKLPRVKLSNSIKMVDPASPKQLDYLKAMGYDVENNTYTKGSANVILSALPASAKQIGFLRWKGYDVSNGVTTAEAKLAFEDIKKKEDKEKEQSLIKSQLPINDLN